MASVNSASNLEYTPREPQDVGLSLPSTPDFAYNQATPELFHDGKVAEKGGSDVVTSKGTGYFSGNKGLGTNAGGASLAQGLTREQKDISLFWT